MSFLKGFILATAFTICHKLIMKVKNLEANQNLLLKIQLMRFLTKHSLDLDTGVDPAILSNDDTAVDLDEAADLCTLSDNNILPHKAAIRHRLQHIVPFVFLHHNSQCFCKHQPGIGHINAFMDAIQRLRQFSL